MPWSPPTGHVEAWQNGHVLRADKITFDRNTGVAAATGNVVLLEPDGEVLFADYAEMHEQHERRHPEGHARAAGSRMAGWRPTARSAPAARSTRLSKVVYSTCNLCAKDPTKPPLWQIRALSGVQDLEHKKIEYPGRRAGDVRRAGRLFAVFLARSIRR